MDKVLAFSAATLIFAGLSTLGLMEQSPAKAQEVQYARSIGEERGQFFIPLDVPQFGIFFNGRFEQDLSVVSSGQMTRTVCFDYFFLFFVGDSGNQTGDYTFPYEYPPRLFGILPSGSLALGAKM